MSFHRLLPPFSLRAAACATAALASGLPAAEPPIQYLDAFVVTGSPGARPLFESTQAASVLVGDGLRRMVQATLGETLSHTPGVTSTQHGPGASRPVIRGLGGDRIRVLENGLGALDASNVSPDHNTAIEPLFASRIEVLRGPSSLLYGSTALGGVVNVVDNSIPETHQNTPLSGALEGRFGGPARERAAVLATEGRTGPFAVHVNAATRASDDLRVPRGAVRASDPARAGATRLSGSAADAHALAVGVSRFQAHSRVGAAISHYQTEYGVPTGGEPAISIRLRQNRLLLNGELTREFGPFRSGRFKFAASDYEHAEIADGTTIETTYTNRAWEGRLDLPHVAVGQLLGSVGVQATRSDFAAIGEEVATPPSVTSNVALFAWEEWKLSTATRLEFGGRVERQAIRLGNFDDDLPPVPGYAARPHQRRRDTSLGSSVGLVHSLDEHSVIAASIAYTERAPTAQELYSHGPHGGTAAYEVGTGTLPREQSFGVDLSVRRRQGRVTGSVSGFVNRFRDYVFQEELPADAIPPERNPEGLAPYQFVARDAVFVGGEAELALTLLAHGDRQLQLDISTDYVRAQALEGDHPLPRTPPWRSTARLSLRSGGWSLGAEARHTFRQNRVAPGELATAGNTLLNADVARTVTHGRYTTEVFLRGRNLANTTAREHTSFLKDVAPLAGRGVLGGVRVTF